jgi:hypothetical protein
VLQQLAALHAVIPGTSGIVPLYVPVFLPGIMPLYFAAAAAI